MNSSELLRNSGLRPPFYELDAVGDENSRVKLQNVVANSSAGFLYRALRSHLQDGLRGTPVEQIIGDAGNHSILQIMKDKIEREKAPDEQLAFPRI
jgi:hypothetical protein